MSDIINIFSNLEVWLFCSIFDGVTIVTLGVTIVTLLKKLTKLWSKSTEPRKKYHSLPSIITTSGPCARFCMRNMFSGSDTVQNYHCQFDNRLIFSDFCMFENRSWNARNRLYKGIPLCLAIRISSVLNITVLFIEIDCLDRCFLEMISKCNNCYKV